MKNNTIVLGCDHAGFEKKEEVKTWLSQNNFNVIDKGTFSPESVDYPDFAHEVAKAVEEDLSMLGILFCGSGQGVNMTANKHAGIRSALCWNEEIARLSRQHNNANILALPARFINSSETINIVKAFLQTEFEGGRHLNRIQKIPC